MGCFNLSNKFGGPYLQKTNFEIGYDAATGEFVDMFEAGIIDPAKVTRSTLQNAASIASMVLTTECIIVDKEDEKKGSNP